MFAETFALILIIEMRNDSQPDNIRSLFNFPID